MLEIRNNWWLILRGSGHRTILSTRLRHFCRNIRSTLWQTMTLTLTRIRVWSVSLRLNGLQTILHYLRNGLSYHEYYGSYVMSILTR